MTSSHLPVDATQGGIVLVTTKQQPRDIANSGRSQVAPRPVVTADSLTPGMEYPKDDPSPIARDLREGRSSLLDAVPCGSEEAWERKKGRKVSRMTEA